MRQKAYTIKNIQDFSIGLDPGAPIPWYKTSGSRLVDLADGPGQQVEVKGKTEYVHSIEITHQPPLTKGERNILSELTNHHDTMIINQFWNNRMDRVYVYISPEVEEATHIRAYIRNQHRLIDSLDQENGKLRERLKTLKSLPWWKRIFI